MRGEKKKKKHESTCSLWQISFLCTQWKLRALSCSSQPLLQQYYSHSQQISQPASILTSKSRTYMPVLKSRSNLYSWVIRTLTQGLLWKALTQAAIKRGYEAVLQISWSFSPNKARIKVSLGQKTCLITRVLCYVSPLGNPAPTSVHVAVLPPATFSLPSFFSL